MQHASPGSPASTTSDLDNLLMLLEGFEVYDGGRRSKYTPVTIVDKAHHDVHATTYLPVTTPFTQAEALRLAPILHKYAPELIDGAASQPPLKPLVTLLLTAIRDTFHEFSDDHDLYHLISAEIEAADESKTAEAPASITVNRRVPAVPANLRPLLS